MQSEDVYFFSIKFYLTQFRNSKNMFADTKKRLFEAKITSLLLEVFEPTEEKGLEMKEIINALFHQRKSEFVEFQSETVVWSSLLQMLKPLVGNLKLKKVYFLSNKPLFYNTTTESQHHPRCQKEHLGLRQPRMHSKVCSSFLI